MQTRDNLAKLMLSPLIVMIVSISISVALYFIIVALSNLKAITFGIVLSTVIPALVSYPVSYVMIKRHKRIEQQKAELERLNEINNHLISIIAHDIRSPISSVYGILDLIKNDGFSKEDFSSHINDLSIRVDNLLSFLDEILQWSKTQIESKETEPEVFNSKKIWTQTIALYQHILEIKNITLETGDLDQSIYGDQGSYSFIVRNVFHNAIKFTPKNGTITVHLSKNNDRTITTIEDNGMGISTEKLNNILNGKKWVSTPGTDNEKGTGFGLKASTKYIEIMDGEFKIESSPENGTKVIIDLPRTAPVSTSAQKAV